MHLAFIDMSKAFDNVKRLLLWSIMEQRGFPSQLIKVLRSLYYKTAVVVDLNGKLSEDIPTNKGMRQGLSLIHI